MRPRTSARATWSGGRSESSHCPPHGGTHTHAPAHRPGGDANHRGFAGNCTIVRYLTATPSSVAGRYRQLLAVASASRSYAAFTATTVFAVITSPTSSMTISTIPAWAANTSASGANDCRTTIGGMTFTSSGPKIRLVVGSRGAGGATTSVGGDGG